MQSFIGSPEEKALLARWFSVTFETSKRKVNHWPLSAVPEVRQTQLEVGPGKCPFCERKLKLKGLRPRVKCFSADCDAEYQIAYQSKPSRVEYRVTSELPKQRERRAALVKAGLTVAGTPRLRRWKDRKPL